MDAGISVGRHFFKWQHKEIDAMQMVEKAVMFQLAFCVRHLNAVLEGKANVEGNLADYMTDVAHSAVLR